MLGRKSSWSQAQPRRQFHRQVSVVTRGQSALSPHASKRLTEALTRTVSKRATGNKGRGQKPQGFGGLGGMLSRTTAVVSCAASLPIPTSIAPHTSRPAL